MVQDLNEVETQLMFGIHSEWNVRNLYVKELRFGRTFVSWVFRDDGPLWSNRSRHTPIALSFVLPENIDWPLFKANLRYHLEKVKASHC